MSLNLQAPFLLKTYVLACHAQRMSVKIRLGGAVDVDLAVNEDFPIFKKYGVMNSGLVDSTRYNQTIFDSLATVKVCPTHGSSSSCRSWY